MDGLDQTVRALVNVKKVVAMILEAVMSANQKCMGNDVTRLALAIVLKLHAVDKTVIVLLVIQVGQD